MKIKSKDYAKILYEITKAAQEGEIAETLNGFILMLSRNNDLKKADEIMKYFGEIYNNGKGIAEVELKSARELSKASLAIIKEYINRLTGAEQVLIKAEVDKKLIGGFIFKYGSTVIDASLKNRLIKMKERLAR